MASGGSPPARRDARVPDGTSFFDLASITKAGVCSTSSWRASGRVLDSIGVLEVVTPSGTVYEFGVDGIASEKSFLAEKAKDGKCSQRECRAE